MTNAETKCFLVETSNMPAAGAASFLCWLERSSVASAKRTKDAFGMPDLHILAFNADGEWYEIH